MEEAGHRFDVVLEHEGSPKMDEFPITQGAKKQR